MQVATSPADVRRLVRKSQRDGAAVGVVPTMGALHAGHISLMECARAECDFVVSTIFVNPTQFGPNEDFDRYPRTLEEDLRQCEAAGVDLAFTPDAGDMYLPDAESEVRVSGLTKKLEGAIRPGHFDGVTTVVAKLFNITVPDRAYFGQKDYQQQLIIKRMVRDLDWGIEVVTCPIVREDDGLAMSSRNRYLSAAERKTALSLSQTLIHAKDMAACSTPPSSIVREITLRLASQQGITLDYAVVADCESLEPATDDATTAVALLAARVGKNTAD